MKKAKTLELTMARAANIKRLDAKLSNLKKRADDYRAFMKKTTLESKKVTSTLDQERLMFLAELIRETGYPVEEVAPIVGAAIEFTSELKSGNPDAKEKLSHYRETYEQFIHEKNLTEPETNDDDLEELEELEEIPNEDELR